jgi:hypothetical protein
MIRHTWKGGTLRIIMKAYFRIRRFFRWWIYHRWSALVAFLLSISLSSISIRSFLFGNGYFEYSDQHWAPSGTVWQSGYFSPSPLASTGALYPLQFTRDIITWPIGFSHLLHLNALVQEKVFYLYSFALFVGLAYVLAALVTYYTLRLLETKLPRWREELARVLIVLFLFTNLYFLYLNVDGGTVTTSLTGIFLGISVLLIIAEEDWVKAIAVTAVLSSVGALLDPSEGFTVLVAILVALILRSVARRESIWTFGKHVGHAFLVVIPSLLFLFYIIFPTLGHGVVSLSYPVRSYNLSAIRFFSANTTLGNVLRLTGYSWTTLTFAPPGILSYSGLYQLLPGQESPTTVLVLPGPLSTLWLWSLYAPAFVGFAALLIRRLRSITIPFAMILILMILLTQWPSFGPSAALVTLLAGLPYVGPLSGEALYFPYFFMLGEAVAIVVLAGGLLTALMAGELWVRRFPQPLRNFPLTPYRSSGDDESTIRPFTRRKPLSMRSLSTVVLVIAIAFFMVFPGWQAFNGSYFPSRSWPTYVSGNGVPNSGPYEPVRVSSAVQETYDFLAALPGAFNIYWPTGGANATNTEDAQFFFDEFNSPKPLFGGLGGSPEVAYLVATQATGSLVSYLQSQNVRYLILQNTSPNFLLQAYGMSSYASLKSFFGTIPQFGVVPLLNFTDDLITYTIAGTWGSTYPVSSVLSYTGPEVGLYPAAYTVGAALGSAPAIIDGGPASQMLSVNNLSGSEAILSPLEIENLTNVGAAGNQSFPSPISHLVTSPFGPFENFTNATSGWSETVIQRPGTILSIANWSLTDWGPSNVTVSLRKGALVWVVPAGQTTTVSINFGGMLTVGPGGTQVLDPSAGSAVASFDFHYRTSSNFTGSLSTYLRDETTNRSVADIPDLSLLTPSLNGSGEAFSAPTLPWTKYFEACFQATFSSGSVTLSLINASWNQPLSRATYHVGYTVTTWASWTITNWSSPGPLYYTVGQNNLTLRSPESPGTVSLNYGPPLVDGYGGVANPSPGDQGVQAEMRVSYRMTPGFSGNFVDLAAFYQTSNSSAAPATGVNGPALPVSYVWRTVSYSLAFPTSTRNFTIRIQVVGFEGSIEFSNISFSWAWLPTQPGAPFGTVLTVDHGTALGFPARFESAFVELSGPLPSGGHLVSNATAPPGLEWLAFSPYNVSLDGGDRIAVIVLQTAMLIDSKTVGTIYTGPFAVDLVLLSDGKQYTPYETVDGDSFFLYAGAAPFTIEHTAVAYMTVSYLFLLAYLALLYPALSYLRSWKGVRTRTHKSGLPRTPAGRGPIGKRPKSGTDL